MENNIIFLKECPSTNSYLSDIIKENNNLPKLFTIATENQTNGRGQRGNQWLSEKGKNLTISILLHPGTISVKNQFHISEVAALAVARTIANYLEDSQKKFLKVKWPNDIYYGDKKISGILIENSILKDKIQYSIIGIGLNVNQTSFDESLTQATSLKLITQTNYDLIEVLKRIHSKFEDMYENLHNDKFFKIHQTYMRRLYRRNGFHSYTDNQGKKFTAMIKEVLPSGKLTLTLESGEERSYNFKEILFNAE